MPPSDGLLYCARCDDAVSAIRPWPWWGACWNVWKVGLVVMLLLTPFFAYDFCVLIPSMMIYLLAGSPLRVLAHQPPICRVCSFELEKGVTSGTAVRRRKHREASAD